MRLTIRFVHGCRHGFVATVHRGPGKLRFLEDHLHDMLVAVKFGEFARATGEEKEVHCVCVTRVGVSWKMNPRLVTRVGRCKGHPTPT